LGKALHPAHSGKIMDRLSVRGRSRPPGAGRNHQPIGWTAVLSTAGGDFICQKLFDITDGNFPAVKNTGRQGRFRLGGREDFMEVFDPAGAGRGNNRDAHRGSHGVDQFDVKARIGAVTIDTVEQDLSGTQLFADPGQGDRVQIPPLAAAFDGALIPAVALTAGPGLGRFNDSMLDLVR